MNRTHPQSKTKTALIIGATGLVGRTLVNTLLDDERYQQVKAFTRSPLDITHDKLQVITTDFDHLDQVDDQIHGDDCFSCLGTTMRKAGNKEAQYKVDVTYQYEFARRASINKVSNYVLISAPGASMQSKIFYNRIKGELDNQVKNLPFSSMAIIKPSVLKGKRPEFRLGEQLGIFIFHLFGFLPAIKKYKPIPATVVAKAMIEAANTGQEDFFQFELDEIFRLAN